MKPSLLMRCVVAAVIAAATSGCGSAPAAGVGRGPMTARALAAIVEDHLADEAGPATSARPEIDGPRAVGGVGAEVRFRAASESSKPAVSVSVGTTATADQFTCDHLDKNAYSGCVATDGGVLFWEKEAPEEDPGVIYVALRKGDATVLMFQSGPAVSGDPRDLNLRISVKDMFDIAKDPRVDVTTSAAARRAGKNLKSWTDQP